MGDVTIFVNCLILVVLMALFIYSMQFNPKCRRRRRKLPHEIRMARRNKEIHAQFEDLASCIQSDNDQYLSHDKSDSDSQSDESYVTMHNDDDEHNIRPSNNLL